MLLDFLPQQVTAAMVIIVFKDLAQMFQQMEQEEIYALMEATVPQERLRLLLVNQAST